MASMEDNMQLVDDCMARESRLTDWEGSYIDSISSMLGKGYLLTLRQEETLNGVWEKVTEDG